MANRKSVSSMTGFARAQGQDCGCSWTIEIKSVNGRNLDIRCRLPTGFDVLEAAARSEIGQRLKRGNVSLTLTLNRLSGASQFRINHELIAQIAELARKEIDGFDPTLLRLDTILSVRGVVEPVEDAESTPREALEAVLGRGLIQALQRLQEARAAEGARLATVLERQLGEIAALVEAARNAAATQPATLKERLRAQVAALLDAVPALSEERLAHEAAILIARGDVREELDRLVAHVAAARDLLAEAAAIGRRFDFLCQEFNREANTLCSKSSDVELTRIGLALKAAIEQLREQVQNIE